MIPLLMRTTCACAISVCAWCAQAELLAVTQASSAIQIQRNAWGITNGLIHFDFIQFDVSSVSGHTIDSATLLIDVVDMVSGNGAVDIRLATNAWSEDTLTFINQPASSAPLAFVPVTSGDVGGTVSVDITNIVQGWADGTIPNHGIALTSADTASLNVILAAGAAKIDVRLGSEAGYAPAQVDLQWRPPTTRIDGTALSPGEIGGYILQMNGSVLSDEISGTSVAVTVANLGFGEYCFQIATRDVEGHVGPFSDADCWSVLP